VSISSGLVRARNHADRGEHDKHSAGSGAARGAATDFSGYYDGFSGSLVEELSRRYANSA
jgi:hypothetical protein